MAGILASNYFLLDGESRSELVIGLFINRYEFGLPI